MRAKRLPFVSELLVDAELGEYLFWKWTMLRRYIEREYRILHDPRLTRISKTVSPDFLGLFLWEFESIRGLSGFAVSMRLW